MILPPTAIIEGPSNCRPHRPPGKPVFVCLWFEEWIEASEFAEALKVERQRYAEMK